MKVVVFAHTPPPFHGQSYMVQLLLSGLGGDHRSGRGSSPHRIQCYHVDARISDSAENVGVVGIRKLLRLVRFCGEAIWCRFRFGARILYYVPAPPKRAALYRDWVVLGLCRPFFARTVFHWHASGLGEWLETKAPRGERWLTHWLASGADASLVLAPALRADAALLRPKRIVVVANGVEDPCPNFDQTVLPQRQADLASRRQALSRDASSAGEEEIYRVLFLASCTREKGLFDAVEAVLGANAELQRSGGALRLNLTVAGEFVGAAERDEFDQLIAAHPDTIAYRGFVSGVDKQQLLSQGHCLCFPSYYAAEALPTTLIEAMAFGLAIVATDWRGIPEMLPANSMTVPVRDPRALAAALVRSATSDETAAMRRHYLERFSIERFIEEVAAAVRSV